MQVLGLLVGTLALAVAQFPHRQPNPGFRNVRTSLATSGSKERPYLSIPIVLMPDGKLVPKPAQISYKYAPQISIIPQQNNQRNPKTRETAASYQVVVPSPSYIHQQKQIKVVTQNAAPGSGAGRSAGSNIQKEQRVINQPLQQYQSPKYIPQQNIQTVSMVQLPNQRNPTNQQQIITNQQNIQTVSMAQLPNQRNPTNPQQMIPQISDTQKQNVLSFINFASHLGAQVVSQQRGAQKNTQSNQMPPTEITYGPSENQKSYDTYLFQGSPTQEQTNANMYVQTQAQSNSVPYPQQFQKQVQPQAVQATSYNVPQLQNQVVSVPVTLQYSQSNTRQQGQGIQQHTSIQNQASILQQNLGATIQFPGNQNNPIQANSYVQVPQQAAPQNYAVVSSQESVPNTRILPNANYDPQSQTVKTIFSTQPQIEVPSFDSNSQSKQQNYVSQNQGGPSYITPESQQINFVNAAQPSPVNTYTPQQSGMHVVKSNSPQNVQASYGQAGDQKVYISYQNPQDVGVNYASAVTLPQLNVAPAVQASQQSDSSQYGDSQQHTVLPNLQNVYAGQNEHTVYRTQTQTSAGVHSPEPVTYTYANDQPSYTSAGQQQDSTLPSGGGKLIYATSSAKQVHYSPAGQGYPNSQLKNNDEQSSSGYVSFPESSSNVENEDGDSDYTKYPQGNHSRDNTFQNPVEDSEGEEGYEETSYKVVYIPLDILRNILHNNSLENQRSEKAS